MKFFTLLHNRILVVLSEWASNVKILQFCCQFSDQVERFRGAEVLSFALRLVAGDFVEHDRLFGSSGIGRNVCDDSNAFLADSRTDVLVDVELSWLLGCGYSRHEVKFPAAWTVLLCR